MLWPGEEKEKKNALNERESDNRKKRMLNKLTDFNRLKLGPAKQLG